jgi:hypothetical protein
MTVFLSESKSIQLQPEISLPSPQREAGALVARAAQVHSVDAAASARARAAAAFSLAEKHIAGKV